MEVLKLDTGIREYQINGNGVLRFNPSDPNVYERLREAADKIQAVEKNLEAQGKMLAEDDGAGVLKLLADADKQMKEVLNWAFGAGNDFDEIMGGVNLLSVATNGERIITNLLNALMPVLQEGAEQCAKLQVDNAVQLAQKNRAQRRAQK